MRLVVDGGVWDCLWWRRGLEEGAYGMYLSFEMGKWWNQRVVGCSASKCDFFIYKSVSVLYKSCGSINIYIHPSTTILLYTTNFLRQSRSLSLSQSSFFQKCSGL